jgi:2-keto-4-pentenoate hydratase/2-oxohepta-3-ene-1,7-dioic acid hydratase in catechol pathway
MQSKTVAEPLFFIKPSTALCPHWRRLLLFLLITCGAVHNELEIAVLIAKPTAGIN